jgi:hypothetical protein
MDNAFNCVAALLVAVQGSCSELAIIDHGVSCASTARANIVRTIHSHPRQALPGGVLDSGAGSGAEATERS